MNHSGSKQQNIKNRNRSLVIRSILNSEVRSRVEIAQKLGLTKTTLTNIVGELIADGLVVESGTPGGEEGGIGRKSIGLSLSPQAPAVLGFLVQRGNLHAVVTDLSGHMLVDEAFRYSGLISLSDLKDRLAELYGRASAKTDRRLLACGVSCLGPINIQEGVMLKTHNFLTTEENRFDIVSFVRKLTGLPVTLCNDATAGAVAEKLFGSGRDAENFIYISTYKGIGAGFLLNNHIYNGAFGQNGELGHMSINFTGPKCVCGNNGCLEVYADVAKILKSYENFRTAMPSHPLFLQKDVTILDLLSYIDKGDALAMSILSDYCRYLAFAVSNLITQLNVTLVIVAASTKINNHFFENTLEQFINEHSFLAEYEKVHVIQSGLGLDAPLYGSTGIIIEQLYRGEIYIK